GGAEERRGWRVTSKIDVRPIRTAVDRLEVTLPADYQYDREVGATPVDLVEDVFLDPKTRTAQVRLAQKQSGPFSITLTGFYPRPKGGAAHPGPEEATLELPHPVAWGFERAGERRSPAGARAAVLDRGGEVTVQVPEGVELLGRPSRPAALAGSGHEH